MVNNQLLLGTIAFGVSFGLSLLVNRDIKPALLTGLIAVPATYAGVFVVNGKQRIQQKPILTALQAQIHQLDRRQIELNQSISATIQEKQRLEVNINFLKTELNQLYNQIADQRSYKQHLSQDIVTLSANSQHLETILDDLQTQVDNCEHRKAELYQSLQSIWQEKQTTEASSNFLRTECNQLQVKIIELQNQKQELEQDLTIINELRPQLKDNLNELQNQTDELDKQTAEVKLSLEAIALEKQTTEFNLNLLQVQLSQLHEQILEKQETKNRLEQELSSLVSQQQVPETKKTDNILDQWHEFVTRLSEPELQVIRAIIQQSDPSADIKKIAEENITMPELLIDNINELALDTIGDLIIEPESEFVPPGILEDYLGNLHQVIDRINVNAPTG